MSAGVGGLELSRSDFVPESDSEDGDEHKVDETVGGALVEETQAYDDDDDDDDNYVGHGVNSTLASDVTPQQVILHSLRLYYN